MLTENEKIALVERVKELDEQIEELTKEQDGLKDELKAEMVANGVIEEIVGKWVVRYVEIVSNRFDTTTFKKENKDLYESFVKESKSMRFTINESK